MRAVDEKPALIGSAVACPEIVFNLLNLQFRGLTIF